MEIESFGSSRKRKAPVSAIIPCYNSSDTIARAVQSILDQTVLPSEIIIVDDASPDYGKTVHVINELKNKFFSKIDFKTLFLAKNVGAGSARNRAWDLSTQPFVAFLDADDAWHPQKIELQYSWMSQNANCHLTCHPTIVSFWYPLSWPCYSFKRTIRATSISKFTLLFINKIHTPTVMLRSEVVLRFNEGKRFSEDYDLWLQILYDGQRASILDLPLASLFKTSYGESGLSSNLISMERGELICYLSLYYKSKINLVVLISVILFSIVKFCRRVFVVEFKRWFRLM